MRSIHDLAMTTTRKMLVGRRVRLTHTTDPYTSLTSGATGTVRLVDDLGTVHVQWDDGSSLGLVPNEDRWVVLDAPDYSESVDIPDRCYCSGNCECAYCLRQIELSESEDD